MSTSQRPMTDRRGRVYTPAVGPRLRPLLWIILGGFALLGANGVYLASVTALTWWLGTTQQTYFYFLMVILHLILGCALIVPFLGFGFAHLVTSWQRPNKAAVRYGLVLLASALVILISGLVLIRIGAFEVRDPVLRAVGYWLHVFVPFVAVGLYVKHRLAGPRIRWEWARRLGGTVAVLVVRDGSAARARPEVLRSQGAAGGEEILLSLRGGHRQRQVHPGRDADDGRLLPEVPQGRLSRLVPLGASLQLVQQQGLPDAASAKRARSHSNATATTQAARWCAGCHDPVPFFSGEFDDPQL